MRLPIFLSHEKKEYPTVTDLGWWKRLAERTEKELEWWYWYEKEGRGYGPDLKEIRKRHQYKNER